MKTTKTFIALMAMVFTVALLTSASIAAPNNGNAVTPEIPESVGSVAMPISDGDKMPDYGQPSLSRELSQVPLPQANDQNDQDRDFEFLLAALNASPEPTTVLAQPAAGSKLDDLLPTGRPMEMTRRPPEEAMQPVVGQPGLRAAWLESADDGSVAPVSFTLEDTPSQTVDPLVLIGPDGNVQVQSDDPYTSKNLLLLGGNLRARDLRLGSLPAKLELDALRFNITDKVTVDPRCEIITHVRNTPAGLDLEEGVPLNIADSGLIKLFFHSAPNVEGLHWGMRAVGDRRAEFKSLIENGKILVGMVYNGTFTISPAVVIYDGQFTYITLDLPKYDRPVHSQVHEGLIDIPEPATMTLLALGGVALIRRRK
jgi:hypothetical protein